MSSGCEEIQVRWNRQALSEAKALSAGDCLRVIRAVESLRDEPLRGTPLHSEWKGIRRLRIGEHLLVYAFDGAELLISEIRDLRQR